MVQQEKLSFIASRQDADLLKDLFHASDEVLVKKLSNNDRDWAHIESKHQSGVYITQSARDSGFFPKLVRKQRQDPNSKAILEAHFITKWPQLDGVEKSKNSRLVNYRSKGEETHLTGLPRLPFTELTPASLLVMGRSGTDGDERFHCLTIDSNSEEYPLLMELFDLDPSVGTTVFNPKDVIKLEHERILDFAENVIAAWQAGQIGRFAEDEAAMPNTSDLARMARGKFFNKHGLSELDPFKLAHPGDAIFEISRQIEWDLFKEFQRRERAVALVRIVVGDSPVKLGIADLIRRLVDRLPEIDALMLSASQQRKSRAGYSYEHQIEAMLVGGGIPHEKQVVLTVNKKRPDFVLPSLSVLEAEDSLGLASLILSAKTTLRERWKQVDREKGLVDLYLATVDENVSGNSIEDMASFGVILVVPERFKKSKDAEYESHSNVITFREFCDEVIKPNLGAWK